MGLYRKAIPVSGRVRCNNPPYLEAVPEAEISVGGGVEWRWATAAVVTAAVALRAEVSRACAAQRQLLRRKVTSHGRVQG